MTSIYIGNYYEVAAPSGLPTVKKYDYAGNQRVAMKSGTTLYWLLSDRVPPGRGGTAITVSGTTETGEVRYYPFGVDRYTSGTTPTSFKYTGQRQESGIGLYYYGARWYDPALGRFVQPDTIVPDPGDAKAFDRYAYVLNNPLKYNDPDGHLPCSPVFGQLICNIWQNLTTASPRIQEAMTPEHDAVGVYIPFPTDSVKVLPINVDINVNGGGTGGIEVIRNRHTGVVTAFSVTGGGIDGTAGVLVKPFQVTLIRNIDTNNLNYSGMFAGVDFTLAAELGLTFGYAWTPQQEFTGWRFWQYIFQDDQLAYSFIIGPAAGTGASLAGNVVYYTPLFDYADGEIIPHGNQLTEEEVNYAIPFVELGIGLLNEQ